MLDTPSVIQITKQPTAVIHLVIPKDHIGTAMGPGLNELLSTIAAQGIKPAGPWFTHHFRITDDSWDFEISVPVTAAVTAQGRVKPGELPEMQVVRTVYQGSYEGLGSAWGDFLEWIRANGHKTAPDLYERYLAGPESGSDPANWRTELTKPLL